MGGGPLAGIRLIEFANFMAGPAATEVLASFGAEVIKVESQVHPDGWRMFTPIPGVAMPDIRFGSSPYDITNLNKHGITLNLTKKEGVELAKRLCAQCDVVMENMTPGVVPRMGLGYEEIKKVKPDIIYMSSSACGQTGPERDFVGYAPVFANISGLGYLTGYEDGPSSNFLGSVDIKSAKMATFALLAAIFHRQATGEGQFIDLASQEAMAVYLGDVFIDYAMNGRVQHRRGNHHECYAPHNCYKCRGEDTWISIAVTSDEEWKEFCRVIDRTDLADDPRFRIVEQRMANQKELDETVTQFTKDQDLYPLMEKLQAAGIAAMPSLNSEGLFNDPHAKERQIFREIDHPGMGKDWVVAPPFRLSKTPAVIGRHAPVLGEHNDLVFGDILGMGREEIERLKREEVIY